MFYWIIKYKKPNKNYSFVFKNPTSKSLNLEIKSHILEVNRFKRSSKNGPLWKFITLIARESTVIAFWGMLFGSQRRFDLNFFEVEGWSSWIFLSRIASLLFKESISFFVSAVDDGISSNFIFTFFDRDLTFEIAVWHDSV